MARLVITIIFVCLFAVATGFYLLGGRDTPADKLKEVSTTPRIAVTHMTQWRFRGTAPLMHLTAGRAEYREPNLIRMVDGVTLVRGVGDKETTVTSATADAKLNSQKLEDIFGDTRVLLVESDGTVIVHAKDSVLTAEKAQYLPDESLLKSDSPFRLDGPGRWLSGQQGFRYDLSHERISVSGPVEGILRRAKSSAPSKKAHQVKGHSQ